MYHLVNMVSMGAARDVLLSRIVDDVAENGLGDRSLRDLAASVDSSHRLLLYHFGSRPGLVEAIVERVEANERDVLARLADAIHDPIELVRALWRELTAPEVRPFIRLFFETVAYSAHDGGEIRLTEPWLATTESITARLGVRYDAVDVRLGIAVTRGLLIDVLTTGDVATATASLERFLGLWSAAVPHLPRN